MLNGPVDPLTGVSLGVNPTYAMPQQSMFADALQPSDGRAYDNANYNQLASVFGDAATGNSPSSFASRDTMLFAGDGAPPTSKFVGTLQGVITDQYGSRLEPILDPVTGLGGGYSSTLNGTEGLTGVFGGANLVDTGKPMFTMADAVNNFQAENDAKVSIGSYDRFKEIGNALTAGEFGNAWSHVTFEASPDARVANNERLFPTPSPAAAALSNTLAGPLPAITTALTYAMGGSDWDAYYASSAASAFGAGASALSGYQLPKAPTVGQVASIGRNKLSSRVPVKPGEAGRFGDLEARAVTGDQLTPHHMPQAAARFTGRADGGALVLPEAEHMLTRTYGYKGAITAQNEASMPFRDVLARDIRDVRGIGGSRYNDGLKKLADYYRSNFPDLMNKQ
ncbi:hypothetical protein ACKI2N_032150 [Cupriavidus sp. 30B13]|uniref:hypothetical protein n=1 Tax=Cupriavidus sp. 30B13 TaxID=3384241 RepID=UPI003CF89219